MVNATLRKQLEHAIRVSEKQVIADYKKFQANLEKGGYSEEAMTIGRIISAERIHLGELGRIKHKWVK
jgi:hypothetical protein